MELLSYSTVGFSDRNIEAALDAIAVTGFNHAEILGQEPHVAEPPKGEALCDFRFRLEGRGLGANVHAPLGLHVLGVPDESLRLEKVKVLKKYLRFTCDVGARNLIVHPIPNPIFVSEPDNPLLPTIIFDAARRSLEDLISVAEKLNVCILLENLPYNCRYPLLTMRDLKPFIDKYPCEYVGLIVDTGHAGISGDEPAKEIGIAGDRLYGVHLHDTDLIEDKHWIPTVGKLDWDAIRLALTEIEYNGPWTFEVINSQSRETPDEIAKKCYQIANNWWQ